MNTYFMERAIELARRGWRKTCPNPCVGAVITRAGDILGEGWHKEYGGPHAEIEAIEDAKKRGHTLEGATLWVTLEPCNHHGKTPPCTHAILKNGITRVVVGAIDPNPCVEGGGVSFLRGHGLEVITGVKEDRCKELIRDFRVWSTEKRPYVILKLAQTLDGKIATRTGDSRWVSCPSSRERVQELRKGVDAVLIGANTFFKDDPRLTVRARENKLKQPLAIVITSRIPPMDKDFYLLSTRPSQTLFWIPQDRALPWRPWRDKGIEVWEIPLCGEGKIDLKKAMERIFQEKKCYHILCEGGGMLAQSLVQCDLVDELQVFISPKTLGDVQGVSPFSGAEIEKMKDAVRWRIWEYEKVGMDLWIRLFPEGD